MQVATMTHLSTLPPLGAFLGNTGTGAIVDNFNKAANSGSVLFGSDSDPFKTRWASFTNTVTNAIKGSIDKLQDVYNYVTGDAQIMPVNTVKHLDRVPKTMQPYILGYAPIYKQLEEGNIYGWGWDAEDIPSDEPMNRLINNGNFEQYLDESGNWASPEFIEHEFTSDDPDFNLEEIGMIEDARLFIDSTIQEELSESGDRIDPTTNGSGARMGKLR